MSEQPGERLARIKREHPLWSIRHVSEGFGFTAHRGGRRIWAATLSDLKARLRDADHGPRMHGGAQPGWQIARTVITISVSPEPRTPG